MFNIRLKEINMEMSDKLYNILKKLCTIIIPASCSLYWGLSGIWGWPYAEQIVGTGSVICTFIGALIGISTDKFWKDKEIVEVQSNFEDGEDIG